MTDVSPWADWPLDREIVLTRLVDAPIARVYRAWTDPEQIPLWFGPEDHAIATQEMDLREGGLWRFTMTTSGGVVYPNRMRFVRLVENALIEVLHGDDKDDDPGRFAMLVTFDAQQNGKTVVTLRQMHPTKAQRAGAIGFGAVEYGQQTLAKLAAFVA